jgi:subtilisin
MRRVMPMVLALLLAIGASPPAPARAAGPSVAGTAVGDVAAGERPLSADGRFIVILKDGSDKDGKGVDRATTRAGRLGVAADRTFRNAIHGYAARLDVAQVAALRADPDVAAVVPDEVISMAGQATPTGVRRVHGKESLVAGINGSDERVDADVAIVDTGIGGATSRTHEDLNIAGGINCSTGRTSRARSARSTTASAWWAWRPASDSGPCASWTRRATG